MMISAAHMSGHATLQENVEKMCNFMRLSEYLDHIFY